jgi:hypothetical protein
MDEEIKDTSLMGKDGAFRQNLLAEFKDEDKILVNGKDFYQKIGFEKNDPWKDNPWDAPIEEIVKKIGEFKGGSTGDALNIEGIKTILLNPELKEKYDAKLKKYKEQQKANQVDAPTAPLSEPTAIQDISNIPEAPPMDKPAKDIKTADIDDVQLVEVADTKDKPKTAEKTSLVKQENQSSPPPVKEEAKRSTKWEKRLRTAGVVLATAAAITAVVLTGGAALPIIAGIVGIVAAAVTGAVIGKTADDLIYDKEQAAIEKDFAPKMDAWKKEQAATKEHASTKEITNSISAEATSIVKGVDALKDAKTSDVNGIGANVSNSAAKAKSQQTR